MGNKDLDQKYTQENTVKYGNLGTKKRSQLIFERKI